MESSNQHTSLRVRLPEALWRRFTFRASLRQRTPGAYADLVFRYLLHEHAGGSPFVSTPWEDEPIYFQILLPGTVKERLLARSAHAQANVAALGGQLLGEFVERYEKDPRDLLVIHSLRSRMDETPTLSVSDLARAIALCDSSSGVRLPPGYLAKWLQARLQPWLPQVENDGAPIEITVELVSELLSRVPEPARRV